MADLYGWLRKIAEDKKDGCNGDEKDGADFQYDFELDTDWALSQGIDLHKLLRVGNFSRVGHIVQGNPRSSVTIPLIHVELNSWGWDSHYPPGTGKPQDWAHRQANCKPVDWPFDPMNPTQLDGTRKSLPTGNNSERGAYVRLSGSLLTDSTHYVRSRPGPFFCRAFQICENDNFVWEGSVPDWAPIPPELPEPPDHPARYTEMHPPDLIEVLKEPPPPPSTNERTLATVRGLAMVARSGIDSCEGQEFDIYPEAPRPTNGVVKYEELRSSYPEVHFPQGENQDNGSWVGVGTDHIHVRAHVCGGFPPFFGSAGRFKALYRVWWEVGPPPQPDPGTPNPPGRACRRDQKCCDPLDDGTCGQCVPRNRRCD